MTDHDLLCSFNDRLPVLPEGIRHSTFIGVPMWQWPVEIVVWEYFMREIKEKIARIVELGTFHGGLSLYLWLWARSLGIDYVGFDKIRPSILDTRFGKLSVGSYYFDECFNVVDIHASRIYRIDELISSVDNTLLVCDDGNKRLEVWNYGANLRPGSYLAVHDWMAEIKPEDISLEKFSPFMEDIAVRLGSLWRFFVKR